MKRGIINFTKRHAKTIAMAEDTVPMVLAIAPQFLIPLYILTQQVMGGMIALNVKL
jgi:hypothetical protein